MDLSGVGDGAATHAQVADALLMDAKRLFNLRASLMAVAKATLPYALEKDDVRRSNFPRELIRIGALTSWRGRGQVTGVTNKAPPGSNTP